MFSNNSSCMSSNPRDVSKLRPSPSSCVPHLPFPWIPPRPNLGRFLHSSPLTYQTTPSHSHDLRYGTVQRAECSCGVRHAKRTACAAQPCSHDPLSPSLSTKSKGLGDLPLNTLPRLLSCAPHQQSTLLLTSCTVKKKSDYGI